MKSIHTKLILFLFYLFFFHLVHIRLKLCALPLVQPCCTQLLSLFCVDVYKIYSKINKTIEVSISIKSNRDENKNINRFQCSETINTLTKLQLVFGLMRIHAIYPLDAECCVGFFCCCFFDYKSAQFLRINRRNSFSNDLLANN